VQPKAQHGRVEKLRITGVSVDKNSFFDIDADRASGGALQHALQLRALTSLHSNATFIDS
jgi:hypothetical protein